ncbi:MAG TPA: SBBP repeat-containing protein [Bryobacteraceae bacterium]|nr:SBBP repeat-containing protein [Bryobacteraceae bacterium]
MKLRRSYKMASTLTLLGALAGSSLLGAPPAGSAKVRENIAKLPLRFEENQGQTDSQVKYLAHGNGYTLFLTPTAMAVQLKAAGVPNLSPALQMRLPGSSAKTSLEARDRLPGTTNYFIGNDPGKWHSSVPGYAQIAYRDVYPGIDLVYRGSQRQLEFDFIVRPGSKPDSIRLAFDGADQLSVDGQGNVRLEAGAGHLILHKPVLYQESARGRIPIEGRFVRAGKTEIAFNVAKYDDSKPLVVDPALEISYATLFGGSGDEAAFGIAVDGGGNAYIAGTTSSASDLPTLSAAYASYGGGTSDYFVTKFNSTGTALVYSTYLGGSGNETGNPGIIGGIANYTGILAVDPSGNAYVTGYTTSANFPTTTNAYMQTLASSATQDAFVTEISPSGSSLLYSTYLGDTIGASYPLGIAADNAGNAYITGLTISNTLPVTANAYSSVGVTFGNFFLGFLSKFNTTLSGTASLAYSSYIGGSNNEGVSVAVDNSGNAYVGGELFVVAGSGAGTIPAVNAIQSSGGGAQDGFVEKFSTTAPFRLVWSTYMGGSGLDYVQKVALDTTGVYLAGSTASTDFITTSGAFQTAFGGGGGTGDGFVTKLSLDGQTRLYSTYIGGTGADQIFDMAIDSVRNVYLTGTTQSPNFPQINTLPPTASPGSQFVLELNSAGSALTYSTLLPSGPQIQSLAADPSGNVYIAGQTSTAAGFPATFGAYQSALKGNSDAFLAKLTNGGGGALAIGAVSPTRGGSSDFIRVTVQGFGIVTGANINLVSSGGTISGIGASTALDGSSITALFNLVGATQTVYDVTIVNPSGATATLPMSFTVEPTVLSFPSAVGNVSTVTPTVLGPTGAFLSSATVKLTGPTTIVSGPTTVNADGSGISISLNMNGAPTGMYTLTVNNPDGTFWVSPGGLTVATGGQTQLEANLTGPAFYGAGHTQTYLYSACNVGTVDALSLTIDLLISLNVTVTLNVPATVTGLSGTLNDYEISLAKLAAGACYVIQGIESTVAGTPAHTPAHNEIHVDAPCCLEGGSDADAGGDTDIREPGDPNDKVGPTGGGGASQWITGQNVVPYYIYFENESTASAPAQNVTITDTLDPGLNPNTISFGAIGFGTRVLSPPGGLNDFNALVDLRPTQPFEVKVTAHYDAPSNTITWQYLTIDPETGTTPNDPSLGFLAPNVTSPQGQGYVYFTAVPYPSQSTGTVIQNQATIVFDFNQPIPTSTWMNTLDVNVPVSAVAALPSTESSACFTVSWSGTDIGSGVQSYIVFASDNGGAFTRWLVDTTLTSSTYTGVAGHTYAFYSEAVDAAGNLEQKTTADTTTTVNANATGCGGSPGLSISKTHTGNFTVNQNGSFSITVSNSGTAATSSTITVSDTLPSGLGFVSANGSGWSCMNSSGNVVCTNTAPIAAGSNAVITLTVSVTTTSTSIQNTASVTGGGGSIVTGSSTDTVTVLQGPSISTQPQAQTACSGASVTFTAAATGSPTPTVQWQVSTDGGATFTNLTGATSTTLSFTSAASQNNNQYRAVFTNTAGSSNTNAALLTVNTAAAITLNPIAQTVNSGQTATFTAGASGQPTPTVQWQVSTNGGATFSNITGATSTTLSFTTSAGQNGNQYRAVFTDTCGGATTTAATLTVNTGPGISLQPAAQTVCSGTTATFTAAATGNPTPTVQWQVSTNGGTTFSNITGATSTTLSFTTSAGQNGNQYRAVFTNTAGSSNTNAALLTVNTAAAITLNPIAQTVTTGQTATFTAGASGQPTPTVQWQVSTNGGTTFSNITGATSTTLSFTTSAGQNGYQYRAVFTDTCGGATTTAATLTLSSGPTVVSFNVLFGTVGNYAMIGSTRNRLPWEITGVRVTFSEAITTGNINSLSGAGITTTSFTGLGTTTLTWTISPLALGKFTATVAGSGANSLKDSMGNALGLGAGYSQNLKILWGDFNDDGTVNAQDGVLVNQARALPYNQLADMNGDGVVSVLDVQIVARRNGTNQP